MNKKIIVVLIISLALLSVLCSCFLFRGTELDAPAVTIAADKSYIEWQPVANAIQYEIIINNGEKIIVKDSTRYYFTEGMADATVKVRAVGDGTMYLDSSYATYTGVIKATLLIPEISINNPYIFNEGKYALEIFWDAIDNNDGYMLNINNTVIPINSALTSYTYLLPNQSSNYNIKLKAVASQSSYYVDSSNVEIELRFNLPENPQLLTQGINFNLNVSNSDVEIPIILNGYELQEIKKDGEPLELNTHYSYQNYTLTLDGEEVEDWEIGEYELTLSLKKGSNTYDLKYTITIINTSSPYAYNNSVVFNKDRPTDAQFNLVLGTNKFDRLQGMLSPDDYSNSPSIITIKKEYLYGLSVGIHRFMVYTIDNILYRNPVNAFPISVEVINTSPDCYNVWVDLDVEGAYPILRWDYDGPATSFQYIIDGGSPITVSNKNYAVLTKTKWESFNYKVRPAGGVYSTVQDYTPYDIDISYYSSKFYTFMGETYDYIITSQEELNHFVYANAFYRTGLTTGGLLPGGEGNNDYGYKKFEDVIIAFDEGINDLESVLNIAFRSSPIGNIRPGWTGLNNNNMTTIFIIYTREEEPSDASNYTAEQRELYPSHIDELKIGHTPRDAEYNDFKIDDITVTMDAYTSEQLYLIAEAGLKPVPQVGSTALRIMNIAKGVLREIIADGMSDTDKVHAIYDWLIYNVTYDRDILDAYYSNPQDPALASNPCFYLEGVFDNFLAVCDGFAKAFVLLARIEGIEAIRVVGQSKPVGIGDWVNHAWNKVKIDNEWYVVDSTWGNLISTVGGIDVEFLTHAYLMVSDIDLYATHRERMGTGSNVKSFSNPISYTSSEYYKNTFYSEAINLYIESQLEFIALVNYCIDNAEGNIIYLEFYNASGLSYSALYAVAPLPSGHSVSAAFTIGDIILVSYQLS